MSREATRSQRDWLEGEIAAWQAMGLVDEDQARALLGLYESRESFDGTAAIAGTAHVAGPGGDFRRARGAAARRIQLGADAGTAQGDGDFRGDLIGTHAAGFGLRYQLGWRRLSEVAFFLGCLFYGAAIWLLAQIFHITPATTTPSGGGPSASCRSRSCWTRSCSICSSPGCWRSGWVSKSCRSRACSGACRTAGYSLPLLVAPGLWWAYRKNSAITVGIYVPLLAWWVVLQPIAWKLQANPTFFIGAVGSLMMLVAALASRPGARWPSRTGSMVSRWWVRRSSRSASTSSTRRSVASERAARSRLGGVEQMFLILILAAATLIVAYLPASEIARRRDPGSAFARRVAPGNRPAAVGAVRVTRAVRVPRDLWCDGGEPWVPTIVANVAMVALALWLIRFGLTAGPGPAVRRWGLLISCSGPCSVTPTCSAQFGGMLGASLMFFLCGGAHAGSGPLLAEPEGGVPWLTIWNPDHPSRSRLRSVPGRHRRRPEEGAASPRSHPPRDSSDWRSWRRWRFSS